MKPKQLIVWVIAIYVISIIGLVITWGYFTGRIQANEEQTIKLQVDLENVRILSSELLLYQIIEDHMIKEGQKYMNHDECIACSRIIYRYHKKYGTEGEIPIGLDYALILAWIDMESSFNPQAESYAGAIGLTQQMPLTARDGFIRYLDQPNLTMEQVVDHAKKPTISLILGLDRLVEYQLGFMATGHASALDWKLSLSLYNWSTKAVSELIQARKKRTPKASLKYAIDIEERMKKYKK